VNGGRELILERIRAAAATASPPGPVSREYLRCGSLAPAPLLDLLCARIGDYRAQVRRLAGGELRGAIAQAFSSRGARRVAVPRGVPGSWRPDGLELVPEDALDDAALDALDGVLTGATIAIAQTGTIVLTAGPAEGRRALSLVPDLHVCVIGERQVVELVPQAIERIGELAATARPITFIAGPSATSDIELNRVEGVHGPRNLIVLVVEGELP